MDKKTELITNRDDSIFHLHLHPEDISNKIVLVGDPGRVEMLASNLTDIRTRKENREFKTVTGTFENSEITIVSTGIGTDNIDIVVNELDALVNIDLKSGLKKEDPVSLTFIRIGTSGALREDIPVGATILAETAIGLDGLIHFYEGYDWLLDLGLTYALVDHLEWPDTLSFPYAVNANKETLELFNNEDFLRGITVSAPGFYGPQGRTLRLNTFDNEINNKLASFSFRGRTLSNYEMESSAIYALSGLLGHKALTLCTVIGNRVTGEFLQDYNPYIIKLALKVFSKI